MATAERLRLHRKRITATCKATSVCERTLFAATRVARGEQTAFFNNPQQNIYCRTQSDGYCNSDCRIKALLMFSACTVLACFGEANNVSDFKTRTGRFHWVKGTAMAGTSADFDNRAVAFDWAASTIRKSDCPDVYQILPSPAEAFPDCGTCQSRLPPELERPGAFLFHRLLSHPQQQPATNERAFREPSRMC